MFARFKNWLSKSGIKYVLVDRRSPKYGTEMMDSINPMVKVIENPEYPLARIYRDSVFQGIIDTYDVLMGNHYDYSNNDKGRKGVLDIFILPLISRRIFFEFIDAISWKPDRPKMTAGRLLRFVAFLSLAIPATLIEIARTALALVLTTILTPVVIGVHSIAYFKSRDLKNKIQQLQIIEESASQNYSTQSIQQSLGEWMKNNKVTDVNQLEHIAEEPGYFRKKTQSCLFPYARILEQKFKLAPGDNSTEEAVVAYNQLNLGKHVRMR